MEPIVLTPREKEYIQSILKTSSETSPESVKEKLVNKNKYDLNYRLKKKFLKLHEDYWTLVQFFKLFDQNFQVKSTNQTTDSLLTAKSQIQTSETLHNAKCAFCKGAGKKMVEINICTECQKNLGI